jgi:hypothetical protein
MQQQPVMQQPMILAPQPAPIVPASAPFQLGGNSLVAGDLMAAFQPFTDAFIAKRQQTQAHHQQPQYLPGHNGYADINSLLASGAVPSLVPPAGAGQGVPSAAPAAVPAPNPKSPIENAIFWYERLGNLSGRVPDELLSHLGHQVWAENFRTPIDPQIFMSSRTRGQKRDGSGKFVPQAQGQQLPDDPQQQQQQQQPQQQQFQGVPGMMIPQMMPMMQQPLIPGMVPGMVPGMIPQQQLPMQQQPQLPLMPSPLDPNKLKQQFGLPVQPQQPLVQGQPQMPQQQPQMQIPQPASSTVPQPQQQSQAQPQQQPQPTPWN